MNPFGAIHRNSHLYELRWKVGDDGYRFPTFPAFFSIKPTQWIITACGGVHRGQENLAMVWPKYFMDAPLRENLERFCTAFMDSEGSDCPWHIVEVFQTIVRMARESMHTRWMMGFVWEMAAHLGQHLLDEIFGELPMGLRAWDLLTKAT